MSWTRPLRAFLPALLGAGLLAAAPRTTPAPDTGLDRARALHVLNRLAFGPRPGDVEGVAALGVDAWIDQQLHPERLPEPDLRRRLAGFDTLELDAAGLMAGYGVPPAARRELQAKRAELGPDPTRDDLRRARLEVLTRYRDRMQGRPREVLEELQAAKLVRAAYAERQLQEVLTDFWLNHFNVYARKGPVLYLVGPYERDVIRPRVLGRFEDLLRATAESPAMLFYLDNWLSSADAPAPARAAPGRRRGLNENYARELLELHTLGVDGGYTQRDVTEVARCFTGWTLRGLGRQRPEFAFVARLHEPGDKLVLGRRIRSGGQREGEQVLHLLATHPSTARFVSLELARRLVADDPPAGLVERAARTFRESGGDLRALVLSIVGSPEFFAAENRQAKLKTPFEFVVSALRASGADAFDARALGRRLAEMGMPLYLDQPPTGYPDTAQAWAGSGALLARLNFALELSAGALPGVELDPARVSTAALVPGGLSETTLRALGDESAGRLPRSRRVGLLLGSPEFQRR